MLNADVEVFLRENRPTADSASRNALIPCNRIGEWYTPGTPPVGTMEEAKT